MAMHADYLWSALSINKRRTLIDAMVDLISNSGIKFDTIAFTGISGALIAPSIADRLGKNLICVRKTNDGSHSAYKIEGCTDGKAYIIIDDLICSGNTINSIVDRISNADFFGHMVPVAIFLYHTYPNSDGHISKHNGLPVYSYRSQTLNDEL